MNTLTAIWHYFLWIRMHIFFIVTFSVLISKVPFKTKSSLYGQYAIYAFTIEKTMLVQTKSKPILRPTAAYIDTLSVFPYEIIPFLLLKYFNREYTSIILEWQLSNANSKLRIQHSYQQSFNPCCQEAAFINNNDNNNLWYKPEQQDNRRGFLVKKRREQSGMQNIISFEQGLCYSFKIKGWKDDGFRTDIMPNLLDIKKPLINKDKSLVHVTESLIFEHKRKRMHSLQNRAHSINIKSFPCITFWQISLEISYSERV